MNEMEKIAELYLDTAYELEKVAAEEGVDLDEVIADMDDEEVAELLDAAVENRLADEDYEVEASAFMFKTAELLEKVAYDPATDSLKAKYRWERGQGKGKVMSALRGGKEYVKALVKRHPKKSIGLGLAGAAGLGYGAKALIDRRRRRRG